MTLQKWRVTPSARDLILSFLTSIEDGVIDTASLISLGRACGVDDAAMRMAIVRLVREEMLVQVSRAKYAIGARGKAINDRVREWRDREDKVRTWSGRWLVALVGTLRRTERAQTRARERALRLLGFAEAASDHWVRPDNLVLTLSELHSELVQLGLDGDATLLGGCAVGADDHAKYKQLWPVELMQTETQWWLDQLDESRNRLRFLPPIDAAQESLLLGQAVIRALNLDPLLPDELLDGTSRKLLVEKMKAYDALGRECWARLRAEGGSH